jgi:subtilisin family serine protease
MSRVTAVAVITAVVLGACAEAPIPMEPTSLTRIAGGLANSQAADDMYLVQFRGNGVPRDFAMNVAAQGGIVVFAHGRAGIATVSGLTDAGAAALAASPGVASVDADLYTVLDEPGDVVVESADLVQSTANPAGAFFFPRQWHHRQIGAHTAWAAGKLGSATTKVGIIDTGIDYTNLDLIGLIDETLSTSFVVDNTVPPALIIAGARTYADYHFHGTHTGATVSSNAIVGAGVTSKTTLVALKACRANGSCPSSAVLPAILYAADNELHVVNMSLGGAFLRNGANVGPGPSFIATINRVFNYAHQNGLTIVVSAGNSARDMDHDGNIYNTYCQAPHAICVSATGPTARGPLLSNGTYQFLTNSDALASYSNFGSSAITVAAPGGAAAPVWATCSKFSIQVLSGGVPICRTGNFIVGSNGTSMAAPHVTGLAALIASEVGRNPTAIADRIKATADDLGKPGTDPAYGKGRINVAAGAP